eukprot:1177279-Prorocentrum_minimum.AAC.2
MALNPPPYGPDSAPLLTLEVMEVCMSLERRSMCLRSAGISFFATAHAAPSPTHSAVGSVPDRSPRSCPPPAPARKETAETQ